MRGYLLGFVIGVCIVGIAAFMLLSMHTYASEPDEPEAVEVSGTASIEESSETSSAEIVQDEQPEADPMEPEQVPEDVQSEQSGDETVEIEIPETFDELVPPPDESYIEARPDSGEAIADRLAVDGIEDLAAFAREGVVYIGFLGGLLAVLAFSGGMRNAT